MSGIAEQERLLELVYREIQSDPSFLNRVVAVSTRSLVDAKKEAMERAADFEIIAISALSLAKDARVGKSLRDHSESLIQDKLRKWEGKTSINSAAYAKYM